ncbi:MAG: flippase [Patescibacteria group bacterium]|jgi:O-antigen/teichoic acid export membrane protein|nr:flippase [Patescibacteria group bacterium]
MQQLKKIAQNTLIQVVGKAMVIAIALIGFGMMTRYLGQEGYGYFATIYAYLAVFGILVDLGLQMTTTKLISDPQEDETKIISNVLAIRLITSLLFLSFAVLLALLMPYPGMVKLGMVIAIAGFTAAALTSVLTSYFQKNLIMGQAVAAEVSGKLAYLVLTILAIQYDLGLLGILVAAILDSVIVFILTYKLVRQKIRIKFAFDSQVWQKILIATWPIGITIALNLIYFKGDIFIMSLVRTPQEVGLYAAPYKILEVLINIAYLFLGLILPLMSTAAAVNGIAALKKIIQVSFNFLIIMSLPMIVGGYFLGEQLMIMVSGPDFAISGQIIKILFLATATIFIASLFGYAIVALGLQKKMIKFYAINAALSIIGYLVAIELFGYWGAAWMTVVTELFTLISAAYILHQKINFLPDLKTFLKSTIACLIMAVGLYLLPEPNLTTAVPLGALVYFVSLYLLKGFDKKTISEITAIQQ